MYSIGRLKRLYRKVAISLHLLTYSPDRFDAEIVSTAFKDYKPTAYSGRTILFKAMEEYNSLRMDREPHELLWQKLVGEGLVIHEIPGDHLSMMKGACSVEIANIIKEEMIPYLP